MKGMFMTVNINFVMCSLGLHTQKSILDMRIISKVHMVSLPASFNLPLSCTVYKSALSLFSWEYL